MLEVGEHGISQQNGLCHLAAAVVCPEGEYILAKVFEAFLFFVFNFFFKHLFIRDRA